MCLLIVQKPRNESIEDDIDEAWANSVKKVIILADAHNIPENYNNIMLLWNHIGLDKMKIICACDHKMSNIITGIQVRLNSSIMIFNLLI